MAYQEPLPSSLLASYRKPLHSIEAPQSSKHRTWESPWEMGYLMTVIVGGARQHSRSVERE